MAKIKTKPEAVSAADFIDAVPDPVRREDAKALSALFEQVTGQPPVMWGPSIVGFGSYRYRYASGHEGTMCRVGFSPRKAELVLYIDAGRPEQADTLAKLGKHKTGKSCLYVKRLGDIDSGALAALVRTGYALEPAGYVPD